MKHADLVAALRVPSFYGPRVSRVDFLQTHISSVFLTGERAYKLKKPVNFGFLDFSTVELREHFCRAELDLNRRLAPEVYLEVAPIVLRDDGPELGDASRTASAGTEVVDWLVVMRQLNVKRLGTEVIERGEISEGHIDALLELLVSFYRDARTGAGVDAYGALRAVRYNTDENFAQTADHVGKLVSRERYEHIREWTDRFYSEHAELFARRVNAGRIRESHGDLHLGNIFFENPPVIFDCIEFNERFRCGDVAADLAFLAMDLDFRGRADLSSRFVDGFVSASGDTGILELIDFYKCYRAYVRAKVHCFTSADPGLDDMGRRAQRNLARRHFGLAYRYAQGRLKPPLVVVYGLMGTGKTLIARHLREHYGWHVLSTDAVRKQISGVGENTRVYVPYNAGLYSPEMNRRTYEEVCDRAENLLHAGFPVAVDGAFKTQGGRLPVFELAQRAGARLLFLEAACAPDEQQRRLEDRQLHDTRSDGRVEIMARQRREWEPPNPEHRELFARVFTDGPIEATHRRTAELLRERGLLPRAFLPAHPPPGGPARGEPQLVETA
ncbi:MAG: AAA family ATPase [bacterium]|nr:AAA family ATPase [bacterium]